MKDDRNRENIFDIFIYILNHQIDNTGNIIPTIPNPIIVANIELPPYDISGRGTPTTGSKPMTIPIFINT